MALLLIDLTSDILDLTGDEYDKPIVMLKRCIVDLSNDDKPIVKRLRKAITTGVNDQLIFKMRELPRDLVEKIFIDYLDVVFIKELLTTPVDVLRTSIYIHHSHASLRVPPKALTDMTSISKFIIDHIRERVEMFIIFARTSLDILSSLKVNDIFDFYEAQKKGKYIVMKVSKNSAIVQRIKFHHSQLYYNGMIFKTVTTVPGKRRINFNNLSKKCIFNPEREQSICFMNKFGFPTEIVYYGDGGVIVEKHSNMSNYVLE